MTPSHPPDRYAGAAAGPAGFARAVDQLRSVRPRREIVVSELPPPQRLAPFAYALGAEVQPAAVPAEIAATGRLVLLYDPAGQSGWQGRLRLVSYITAELEPDLAADPLLPEVGWSWLTDALAAHAPGYAALAGTVTQTTSTRFGELAGDHFPAGATSPGSATSPAGATVPVPATADLEIRASWTPEGDLAGHLTAWYALLASTAGLPPPGVSPLRGVRSSG